MNCRNELSSISHKEVMWLTACNKNEYILKGPNKSVEDLFNLIKKHNLTNDIKIQKLEDKECNILSDLTDNKKKILNYAKKYGYYDYPRKITSDELAKKTGIDKDIILESLRKAEKRIIARILEDTFL